MTLLLIRHGETALNVARVLQPADTPLGPRGLAQARALGARLAAGPLRIASILTSDLPRALQTATAIAAATGAPLAVSALWQERNFGDWRGRPHGSFGFDPLVAGAAPPGGESTAAFAERVAQAFADALRRHATVVRAPDTALAVVTHGLVLRLLLERHVALPADATREPLHFGNTGLTVVAAEPPHLASLVDCTAHLAAGPAEAPGGLSGG